MVPFDILVSVGDGRRSRSQIGKVPGKSLLPAWPEISGKSHGVEAAAVVQPWTSPLVKKAQKHAPNPSRINWITCVLCCPGNTGGKDGAFFLEFLVEIDPL